MLVSVWASRPCCILNHEITRHYISMFAPHHLYSQASALSNVSRATSDLWYLTDRWCRHHRPLLAQDAQVFEVVFTFLHWLEIYKRNCRSKECPQSCINRASVRGVYRTTGWFYSLIGYVTFPVYINSIIVTWPLAGRRCPLGYTDVCTCDNDCVMSLVRPGDIKQR